MANNIINFPRARKRRKKITEVLVDRLTDTTNHVDLGHIPFTCPECNCTTSFDFTGAIFRTVSFYCSNCGHGYQVSNPMFSTRLKVIKGK